MAGLMLGRPSVNKDTRGTTEAAKAEFGDQEGWVW